jgi:glycosyltransferase involved in cell wall biosynthesis
MTKILFIQSDIIEIIVENGKPRGGAVVESLVWMKALNELGIEVQLLRNIGDSRKIMDKFNWVIPIETFDPNKGVKWLRWIYYRFPRIFFALKKSKADFIYESIPTWNSFFIGLICKALRIKQIIRIANDNMLDERVKLTHSKFEQIFLFNGFKVSDYISVQNDFQFNALKKNHPNTKIIKLFNPILIEKNQKIKEYKTIGYIAWVANFRYQKNLELLYNIVLKVPNINFKVAGQPLSNMDNVTAIFVDKLKKLPNVEFVGVVERKDILNFFSESKFLLNTSRYEGFSNTFLEAMVTGTPILTTNLVNPDGIIDGYGLGYIYKDESHLKNILDSLTEEDYLLKSKNCIEFVQNNHDHLVLGQKLINFLEEGAS